MKTISFFIFLSVAVCHAQISGEIWNGKVNNTPISLYISIDKKGELAVAYQHPKIIISYSGYILSDGQFFLIELGNEKRPHLAYGTIAGENMTAQFLTPNTSWGTPSYDVSTIAFVKEKSYKDSYFGSEILTAEKDGVNDASHYELHIDPPHNGEVAFKYVFQFGKYAQIQSIEGVGIATVDGTVKYLGKDCKISFKITGNKISLTTEGTCGNLTRSLVKQ